MKICQITSMHDWDDDRIFQRACSGLARRGFDVHLVATRPADATLSSVNNVNLHWINPRSGLRRRIFSSKEAIEKAIEIKADVYHFHDPDLLPFVGKLKRKLPQSIVLYDIHENYAGRFYMWDLPKWIAGILSKIFKKFEEATIDKLDGYSVVSDSMKQLFTKVKTPGILIRNSTDMELLKEINLTRNPSAELTIYTSGINSHQRNCIQTVQALPAIVALYPEVKMLFVGRYAGDIKNEMSEQSIKDHTQNNLVLDGMLPWKENFERTAQAFCGCVFYADNPNNRVGIPNRLFEYMYTGIPVVASDFPELRKIVTDANCGVLVHSDDPESIVNGIISLLKDPAKAREMGKNGQRAMQEKYGYHVDLENTVHFYQSLLNQ